MIERSSLFFLYASVRFLSWSIPLEPPTVHACAGQSGRRLPPRGVAKRALRRVPHGPASLGVGRYAGEPTVHRRGAPIADRVLLGATERDASGPVLVRPRVTPLKVGTARTALPTRAVPPGRTFLLAPVSETRQPRHLRYVIRGGGTEQGCNTGAGARSQIGGGMA